MLLVVVSELLAVLHLQLYILPYWTVSSETELSSSGNTVVSQKSVFKEGEEEGGGGEEAEVNPSRMTLWEKLLVVALISCSSRHAWKEGETKEYKSMK